MTTAPISPTGSRVCPKCQYDSGNPDAEACPECGTSLAPHCIICGYDLKGLARDGVCPECGTSVEQSYLPDLLQNRSPEYLGQLRSGLSFVLNGILAYVCVVVLGIFSAFVSVTGAELFLAFAGTACSIAILVGWWRLTTPDPGMPPEANAGLGARQIIRIAVCVQLAASIFGLVPQFSTGQTLAPGMTAIVVLSMVLGLLSLVAWVAQFFAAMLYVRWLARRVPDQKLHNRAKRFMWLGPLLQTVGLLLIGLGPLIALVMYWNMLDVMRKHIKRMLAAT